MTAPFPLRAHLEDAVLLPLVDGRQAAQLDEKRCGIVDVLTFPLDTRLVGFDLSLANALARRQRTAGFGSIAGEVPRRGSRNQFSADGDLIGCVLGC
jgi:hypothetical protein